MKTLKQNKMKKTGFTITELLVVVVIIGILLSLLIPAVSMVHEAALNVKQKSQFTVIEAGLEAFRNDFGDYPPSNIAVGATFTYSGAQVLAEAMVGRDAFGVHPDSVANGFPADGTDYSSTNRNDRQGLYLELDTANAIKLADVCGALLPSDSDGQSIVLTDVYGKVTSQATSKPIGMPVLYYRANTSGIIHDETQSEIYSLTDNENIPGASVTALAFYKAITNPNFGNRPYRDQTYILQSAGPDGIYGTADDVFNFDNN